MLEVILDIVLKYWVQVLLGLIAGGIGYMAKKYMRLAKEERLKEQKELFEKLTTNLQEDNKALVESLTAKYDKVEKLVEDRYEEVTENMKQSMEAGRMESKADDAAIQEKVHKVAEEMNCLKAGLLSMQGKEFRDNCRKLLEEDHEITLDEWEEIDQDHEAYNGLGGNHTGDRLFALVKKKVENTLTL